MSEPNAGLQNILDLCQAAAETGYKIGAQEMFNLPPQPTLEMEVPWDGQWREWGSYVQLDSAAETASASSDHQTKPTVKWISRGRERYNPDGSAEIQFFYPED